MGYTSAPALQPGCTYVNDRRDMSLQGFSFGVLGDRRRRTLSGRWLALALLAGCNTMSGMGKDIKAGGQAIEDAANSPTKKKQQ